MTDLIKISKAEHAALKTLLMDDRTGFNPRVYVNLEARFGDNQPKHGVIFDKPVRRKGKTLRIDTYGRGDVHNVKTATTFSRKRRSNWNAPMPFPADLSTIADALGSHGSVRPKHLNVVLGNDSDPFMWMDAKYGVTKATLNLLSQYLYRIESVEIHTRSDLIAHDDYLAELAPIAHRTVICIHIPRGSDSIVRMLEPGAPSAKRRFQAARRLIDRGFKVRIVREGTIEANIKTAIRK